MHRGTRTGIHVGASLILVSFVLLCLATFATLSMVSALADWRLAQKAAEASRLYYVADAEAEQRLAEVDRCLSGVQWQPGGGAAGYFAQCAAALAGLGGYEVDVVGGTLEVRYRVPLGETQELQVELAVAYPPGTPRYSRERWQVVTVGQWEPGESPLELWDGEGGLPLWDGSSR